MDSKTLRIRVGFSSAFAAACIASLLTACSGGGNSSLPQVAAPQQPALSQPAPSSGSTTLNITRSMVAALPSYSAFKYHVLPVQKGTVRKAMATVYPVDVNYHGGAVLPASLQHEVFIDTTAAAVGTPQTFQANFSRSSFIHVLDQYTGASASNRYPVYPYTYSVNLAAFSNVISQNELFTVLHAAAAHTKATGYGNTYNLFLAQGLDTCIDLTTSCYSPDNPPTFTFCAYHGSITFSDIGHVLFTVIPYQHTPGCGDDFPGLTTPNPTPIDDTASALSHEQSEAISDPDPGSGWYNDNFGYEIGDTCIGYRAYENLNGHQYLIQPEYSNATHGCFF